MTWRTGCGNLSYWIWNYRKTWAGICFFFNQNKPSHTIQAKKKEQIEVWFLLSRLALIFSSEFLDLVYIWSLKHWTFKLLCKLSFVDLDLSWTFSSGVLFYLFLLKLKFGWEFACVAVIPNQVDFVVVENISICEKDRLGCWLCVVLTFWEIYKS